MTTATASHTSSTPGCPRSDTLNDIAAGPDGDIWFTVEHELPTAPPASGVAKIGRL